MAEAKAPVTTPAQVEVDIKLVAIPVSTIESLYPAKPAQASNNSFLGKKFKQFKTFQKGGNTQFVRMPKHEYDMYWARDSKNQYVGTEPEDSEEGRRLLKLRLEDEEMQSLGKKNACRCVGAWR